MMIVERMIAEIIIIGTVVSPAVTALSTSSASTCSHSSRPRRQIPGQHPCLVHRRELRIEYGIEDLGEVNRDLGLQRIGDGLRIAVGRARERGGGGGIVTRGSGGGVTSGRAADERDLGAHGASGLVTGPKSM